MKKLSLFLFSAIILAVSLFFGSCAGDGRLTIEKRRYSNGFYVHRSHTNETTAVAETDESAPAAEAPVVKAQSGLIAEEESAQATTTEQAKAPAVETASAEKSVSVKPVASQQDPETRSKAKKETLREKANRLVKKATTPAPGDDSNDILLIILCFLIPPLAIYLKQGITNLFWIDLVCFILGGSLFLTPFFYGGGLWLVAVVLAILVVLGTL